MPSPLGHGLAAVAAAWLATAPPPERRARLQQAAILIAIGVAPDLDLLWGRHSMETHSLGAAALVASLAVWQRWPVASSPLRIWLAVAAAWLTHPLLDALSADSSPPIGIQLLWPMSGVYVSAGIEVFGPISRRYWLDSFWAINLASIAREVVILVPVVVGATWLRLRRPPPPASRTR
jgi:inner membrane protein